MPQENAAGNIGRITTSDRLPVTSLIGLLNMTDHMLEVTGCAPCPVCRVGQLRRNPGTLAARCNACESVYA